MAGRQGADQLSRLLVWGGLGLSVLGSILRVGALEFVGFAAYAYAIFRMFSRDKEKRGAENRRYLNRKAKIEKQWKQARTRFQHRKEYKYFKCPGCHAWLKLPRGAGVVTVTCSRCQNHFTEKA